ncbi:hypothetical protein [Herpetosiphon sp. NSE202]|uniref:hypothetical protein n=1 Tax=Herpetosiphon sp. NSE202 TaxID=3351349 RepID=UPI00362D0FBB
MEADSTHMATLIPELALWNEGQGIDVDQWIICVGSMEHAIGYTRLFWPSFVLFDECIFFGMVDEQVYHSWLDECHGDKTAVERVMNHTHITDLFDTESVAQIRYLGQRLQEMWHAKLRSEFPDRLITVEFHEPEDESLMDYQITVFQPRQ